MTTVVKDLLSKGSETFTLTGVCEADDLLKYKFDRNTVIATIDQVFTAQKEYRVSWLQLVPEKEVDNLQQGLLGWQQLHYAISGLKTTATSSSIATELGPSPNKKLCRRLEMQLSET